jgi:hypothetical protein
VRAAWLRRTQPPRLRSWFCRGSGGALAPVPEAVASHLQASAVAGRIEASAWPAPSASRCPSPRGAANAGRWTLRSTRSRMAARFAH